MLFAPLALAALTAIPEVVRAGIGLAQGAQAKKLRRGLKRPVYETPDSVKASTNILRMAALDPNLPNSKFQQESIAGMTADRVRTMRELGRSSDVASAYGTQRQALNKLIADSGVFGMQKKSEYANALLTKGEFEDKEFAYNADAPYQARVGAAKELGDASTQNVFEGVKNIAGVGVKLASGGYDEDSEEGTGTVGANKTSGDSTAPLATPNRIGVNPNAYNANMPAAGVIGALTQSTLDPTQKNEVIQFLNGAMGEGDLSQEAINFLIKHGITDMTRTSNIAVPKWTPQNAFTYTMPPTVGPVSGNTLTY